MTKWLLKLPFIILLTQLLSLMHMRLIHLSLGCHRMPYQSLHIPSLTLQLDSRPSSSFLILKCMDIDLSHISRLDQSHVGSCCQYLNGLTGNPYSFWLMWIFIVRLKVAAACFGLMDSGGLIMISDNDVLPMVITYELQFHRHCDMIVQLRRCFIGHRLASLTWRFWTR